MVDTEDKATHEDEVEELETTCLEFYSELIEAKEKNKVVENNLALCVVQKNLLKEQNSILSKQVGNLENPNVQNVCQNCARNVQNTSGKIDQVGTRQRLRKVTRTEDKGRKSFMVPRIVWRHFKFNFC